MPEEDGFWSQGFLFFPHWSWRFSRRTRSVSWLPARCSRHHRGFELVEELHRHDGLLLHLCGGTDSHYCQHWCQPSLRHFPWRLQMQAEQPVEQHICKGTVDCLKKIAAEAGIVAGVYKGFVANALRSVGGARRWCSVIESRTTCAWAA